MRRWSVGAWAASALLSAGLLTACGEGGGPPPAPAPGAPAAQPVRSALEIFEELRPHFAEHLQTALEAQEPLGAQFSAALDAPRPKDPFRYPETLRAVYVAGQGEPRFVGPEGILPAGEAVLAALQAAPEHALDPARLRPAGLTAALEAAQAAGAAWRALGPLAPPQGAELEALVAALRGLGELPAGPGAAGPVASLALRPEGPCPTFARGLEQRRGVLAARQRAWASAELWLAEAYLRYAAAMKHDHQERALWEQDWGQKRYEKALERARRKAKERKEGEEEVVMPEPPPPRKSLKELRAAALLTDLQGISGAESGAAALAALVPKYPQYAKLQRELQRYRGIAQAGGWGKVRGRRNRTAAQLGREGLAALQRRLAAEGLYEGPAKGRYDAATADAVKAYQQTHQLIEQPALNGQFWASIAVPVEDRIQRIELSLQRWRESRIDGDTTYVFVNIADFHAEVWRDGERLFRTAVVVGNTDKRCDEETKTEIFGYATPTQSAYISYIVFAPHWMVPPRIKREELEVDRAKDPRFYEKEGYELLNPGTPQESVRQLPGPTNSLGFIKVIFPNEHSVFMHDTPAKGLFQYPVRTFSHGCMRMEQPWDMARTLLELGGQWKEEEFTELRTLWEAVDFSPLKTQEFDPELYETLRKSASELERSVVLAKAVPIHVEYYTVRVDDRGRAVFLADPYRLDARRLDPKDAKECTPDSELAQEAFSGTMSRLEKLEAEAEAIARDSAGALADAAALDPEAGRRHARCQGWGKSLAEGLAQARTLAGQIRAEHEALQQLMEEKEGNWDKRRTRQALRLKRMMDELQRMEGGLRRQKTRLDEGLSSLAPAPAAGDPGQGTEAKQQ